MKIDKFLAIVGIIIFGAIFYVKPWSSPNASKTTCSQCDNAASMPQLQAYLVWMQHEVASHAEALKLPMKPKPGSVTTRTNSSGGSGDPGRTAGWGNGTWP